MRRRCLLYPKKAIHIEEHDMANLNQAGQQMSQFYILTKRDLAEVRKALNKVDVVFEEKENNSPMVFLFYTR